METADRNALIAQLVKHEGLRLLAYFDTVGKITIGVGRNVTDKGLTREEALSLLDHDIDECVADLNSFPWFSALGVIRQRALVDLRFNLGAVGLRKFKKTLAAIEAGEYEQAAAAMLKSKWAGQVGARARRLAAMMRLGEDWRGTDYMP